MEPGGAKAILKEAKFGIFVFLISSALEYIMAYRRWRIGTNIAHMFLSHQKAVSVSLPMGLSSLRG